MEIPKKTIADGSPHIGNAVSTVRKSTNEIIDYITYLENRVHRLEDLVSAICKNIEVQ
jgi:hypothetical protein